MNHKNIKATVDHVEAIIKAKVNYDLQQELSPSELPAYLADHLFFITAQLKYRMISSNTEKQSYAMMSFKKFYIETMSLIIENRKRYNLQPLAYVAYDVEGSRYNNAALNAQIPHLHGIILLNPTVRPNFIAALESDQLNRSRDGSLEKVSYQQHRGDRGDLERIVAYSVKHSATLGSNQNSYIPDLWLPDLPPRVYPFWKALTSLG